MKRILAAMLCMLFLCGCSGISDSFPTRPEATRPPLPESAYAPTDFQWEEGFLNCLAGNAVLGIDVSAHQQEIDWQAVAASGVKFAIIRLGYRGLKEGQLYEDAYARQNLQGARDAGLLVGAYFFSQAVSTDEALEEAQLALQVLHGFQLDMPLVFDWEYVDETCRTAKVDAVTVTACCRTFCDAVQIAGYDGMLYFNTYQGTQLMKLWELSQYPWWLAMYDTAEEMFCKVDMWQYSSTGSVPGIRGDVDLNLMFTDYGLGKTLFGGV